VASEPPGGAVRFTLDGRPVAGRAGQSVAAALLGAGVATLTRSGKYRRPRGIHCANGHCPGCLLRIDGEPHVRACMVDVREGLRVETEGAAHRRFDPYRAIDRAGRLFPVGFQYRYFKRQNAAWRLWERRLRALAADTEIPEPIEVLPAERVSADLLVVGGGPAGLGAAAAAAAAGLDVVLVTRRSRLGGRLRAAIGTGGAPGPVAEAYAAVRASERVRVLAPGTVVAGFGDRWVVDGGARAVEVTARASILATGAYERLLPFPGNDRPGVMLTSALVRLAREDRVLGGRSAVVVASDDAGYALAADLAAAGVRVPALLDVRAGGAPVAARERAERAGTEVVADARVLAVTGRGRVAGVRFASPAGTRSVACDVVGMSGGWQPADELRYAATSTGEDVVRGERARPLGPAADGPLPVLQAVGHVAGTYGAEAAVAEGARAGALAAAGRDG
jgi:sarcosine oxidase subunit alpha